MNNNGKLKLSPLALAGLITISSARVYKANDVYKYYINKRYNDFKKFVRIKPFGNRLKDCYNIENITIVIDNETTMMSEYICYEDSEINKVFDLDTKELVYYSDSSKNIEYKDNYYNDLLENSTVIEFKELDNYLENYTYKEWYSLEDIENIESQLYDVFTQDKPVAKVLKKINTN